MKIKLICKNNWWREINGQLAITNYDESMTYWHSSYFVRSSHLFFIVFWILPKSLRSSSISSMNDKNKGSSIYPESFKSLSQYLVSLASL